MSELIKTKEEYENQINRLYDQLKYRENNIKTDFSNLYMSLSISIAFYGTIMTFISKNMDIDPFILYLFLFLLIPVFTYIFGLLFCYNLFAIVKGGYVTTLLENRIRKIQQKLYKEVDYIGWGIVETQKNFGRVLVYGTILMLYILMPMVSITWGIIIAVKLKLSILSISFLAVSILFYIIYIIFILIIIIEMKRFYKGFQENHNYDTTPNSKKATC